MKDDEISEVQQELYDKIIANIVRFREERNLSQKDVGKIVGCGQKQICQIETKEIGLTFKFLMRIADSFGVPFTDIIFGIKSPVGRFSGKEYTLSPEQIEQIKEKYKNGIPESVIYDWLGI